MESSVTIKDIAKHLKVSTTSVSMILNGNNKRYRISESLKARVLEYVSKSGYVINSRAKNLRTQRNNLISLVVDDITNPYDAQVALHLECYAFERGYNVIYHSLKNDEKKAKEIILQFRNKHVDGCIIGLSGWLTSAYIGNLLPESFPMISYCFDEDEQGVLDNSRICRILKTEAFQPESIEMFQILIQKINYISEE